MTPAQVRLCGINSLLNGTRVFDHHIAARREFLAMHRGPASSQLPAWRIQAPAPAEELLKAYRSASIATGIDWEVLAAVNLVETGMGRIDGVSVANAQGPMQFLPTTWTEPGIGQGGDIRDPWDSIHAAARYLVRRGGLDDIRQGLWGYNDHYGETVLHYAALLRRTLCSTQLSSVTNSFRLLSRKSVAERGLCKR